MKNYKTPIIFCPSIEDGGVEKNLYLISNYLINKLKNLTIVSANNDKKKKFKKNIKFLAPLINFNNSSRRIKALICLFLIFKEFILKKNDFSILCFQANIYAIIFCFIFQKKIIVRSNTSPSGWSDNFLKKKLFSFFFNKANLVIVNSSEFKNEMKKKLNIESKLIYNPLNYKEIKLKSKNKIKIKFYENNTTNFISVGRLTDQKDHMTILNAIKVIKNKIVNPKVKLLIIGKGTNYKTLDLYIKKNKLENIVKLIGYKKNPYPYIKKSDCFVLSSIYEGLPNVLLEAMSLDKYVISSNCPTGPYEILNKIKYKDFFKIRDHIKLAELMIKFSLSKNRYTNKNIKASYRKTLYKFDFERNCEKYYQCFNMIL
jgi:glycosyltransferase involved in cell wall biosynthesis